MHGAGNDFVVIDNRKGGLPALDWGKLADRHFGIGCDQVVILQNSDKADVLMRIFNADGGEVESCGNASRCVAWLIGKETGKPVRIHTLAGVIEASIAKDAQVTINMGPPRLDWNEIPLSEPKDTLHLGIASDALKDPVGVNMGNPHMVFFVSDALAVPLATLGPALEHHPLFPERANVGVAQVDAKDKITLHVWERGAGLTLACGTGACAALVAAHRRNLTGRKATVQLPGGVLFIEWRESDNAVLMTGPAAVSFKGEFDPDGFAG